MALSAAASASSATIWSSKAAFASSTSSMRARMSHSRCTSVGVSTLLSMDLLVCQVSSALSSEELGAPFSSRAID